MTIKASMSSFIENSNIQGEARFIIYEQANVTDCTTREAPPVIKVPFPPPIKPEDLVAPRKNGEVPSRSPNAFLIYRRAVVKVLQAQNYAYKMTDVSSIASKYWKSEPEHVKQTYLQIAGEAKNMLTNTRHKALSFSRRKCHPNNNNNTRTQKTRTSSTRSPRKKRTTTTNTPQSFAQETIQPINTTQRIIEEDRQLSPSFAVSIEDVYSLFSTNNRELIWTQSPVPDVLVVGIDEFGQPQKMTTTSYKRFMFYWHACHLQLFYGNISPIVNNGLNFLM